MNSNGYIIILNYYATVSPDFVSTARLTPTWLRDWLRLMSKVKIISVHTERDQGNENPKKKKNSSREFINLSLIDAVLTSLVKYPTSWHYAPGKNLQFQKMSIPKQDSSNADSQPWNHHSRV